MCLQAFCLEGFKGLGLKSALQETGFMNMPECNEYIYAPLEQRRFV